MKKFILGIGPLTAVAVLIGFRAYNYTSAVQYENENYRFKVPRSVKLSESDDLSYTFSFHGEEITVCTDFYNCTPELASEYLSYYIDETGGETKKLEDCKYTCWVRSSETEIVGEPTVGLSYILGTDTRFLCIDSSCSEKNEEKFRKVMDSIAKSAEYTGDFHIADKPAVYDYEMLSVDTGSKFCCIDRTEEASSSDSDTVLRIRERYAEADDIEKMDFPFVSIAVKENNTSAKEEADKKYDSLMKNPDMFTDMTRDKKERFGYDCEHIYYEYDIDSKNQQPECFDMYWFDSGKYTYGISSVSQKTVDAADIAEMLDGITVKAQ